VKGNWKNGGGKIPGLVVKGNGTCGSNTLSGGNKMVKNPHRWENKEHTFSQVVQVT